MSAAARSGRAGSRAWRAVLALLVVIGLLLIWSAASVQLTAREQAGFAAATILLFLVCNRFPGRGMTLFLVVLSAAVSLRYIVWRVSETLVFDSFLQSLLGIALALAELYAVIVLALGYLQTSWPLERKPEPLPENSEKWPTVDVFIPTYNEDLSVVRATVLAALAIDWPREKLRVYILDDGRRTEFRNFAEAAGAGYIIRPDNAHAKAGNLNHALDRTDGEFVAVFDCDHVPTRAFLQMTMGWMLRDPSLAALQTPHHFYSPDPFQRNLRGGARVPPEGNLFYGLVQCGDDFWNASFFCGSCAVLRRAALEEIGGFAVETVTEDAHTALRLHRAGWNSAYLRLPLAAGLATERLILHIGQRIRWARGMLQILRLDNPLFGRGLSLAQRLCYLNAMAHFLFAVPRVIFLVAPLGFLLLGQNIIAASPLAIVAYALPHIFHAVGTNSRTQRNWRHSFWSEIYETVLALFLVRVTLATLLDPRRGRFNVTEKGGLAEQRIFRHARGLSEPDPRLRAAARAAARPLRDGLRADDDARLPGAGAELDLGDVQPADRDGRPRGRARGAAGPRAAPGAGAAGRDALAGGRAGAAGRDARSVARRREHRCGGAGGVARRGARGDARGDARGGGRGRADRGRGFGGRPAAAAAGCGAALVGGHAAARLEARLDRRGEPDRERRLRARRCLAGVERLSGRSAAAEPPARAGQHPRAVPPARGAGDGGRCGGGPPGGDSAGAGRDAGEAEPRRPSARGHGGARDPGGGDCAGTPAAGGGAGPGASGAGPGASGAGPCRRRGPRRRRTTPRPARAG